MHYINTFLVYLLSLFLCAPGSSVKTSVEQLEEVLQQEKFVAVFFTKECCTCIECVEAEAFLSTITLDLVKDFGILTVKLIEETKLANSFGVKDYPALIFLRDRIPVLYDGKFEREELLDWLEKSRDVALKELNDDTFEHLTQAATGATTGDWLVAFSGKACNTPALSTALDSVAVKVRNKVNVAKVDIETSPLLKDRFKISACPQILFFRLGKMYEYTLPGVKINSLVSFVEGFYRNSKSLPVPKEQSPFDLLVEKSAIFIKENKTAAIAALSGFLIFIVLLLRYAREPQGDRSKTE